MSELEQAEPDQTGIPTLTFEPLLGDHPQPLDIRGDPIFDDAKVNAVEYTTRDRSHQVASRHGKDLVAWALSDPKNKPLVPAPATPTATELALRHKTSGASTTVELRLPNRIKVEPEGDTQFILRWLRNSVFNAARKVGRAAPLILLAIAALYPSPIDNDDDDDDDDDEPEECTPTHHHHRRPFSVQCSVFNVQRSPTVPLVPFVPFRVFRVLHRRSLSVQCSVFNVQRSPTVPLAPLVPCRVLRVFRGSPPSPLTSDFCFIPHPSSFILFHVDDDEPEECTSTATLQPT